MPLRLQSAGLTPVQKAFPQSCRGSAVDCRGDPVRQLFYQRGQTDCLPGMLHAGCRRWQSHTSQAVTAPYRHLNPPAMLPSTGQGGGRAPAGQLGGDARSTGRPGAPDSPAPGARGRRRAARSLHALGRPTHPAPRHPALRCAEHSQQSTHIKLITLSSRVQQPAAAPEVEGSAVCPGLMAVFSHLRQRLRDTSLQLCQMMS